MILNEQKKIKVAILDMYEGYENQGMRCLRDIINGFAKHNDFQLELKEFDVRQKNEVPSLDFDIFISSGGPGSPLESIGTKWEEVYFNWLQQVEDWNSGTDTFPKKNVLFICHSFQLACRHYGIANVTKRNSTSFGVFPIHMIKDESNEPVFDDVKNPFYVVDSRDYQVIEPNQERLYELGAEVLALEKERPHVPYERAIMAVRFNDYFFGTQFHPEADAIGMSMYLQREDKKKAVIENHGEEKWQSMIDQLNDPDKILYTYSKIIPNFLSQAVEQTVAV